MNFGACWQACTSDGSEVSQFSGTATLANTEHTEPAVALLQGPGDDIPRNFSMSDLMAMGDNLLGPSHQPQLDAQLDAEMDLGDGGLGGEGSDAQPGDGM